MANSLISTRNTQKCLCIAACVNRTVVQYSLIQADSWNITGRQFDAVSMAKFMKNSRLPRNNCKYNHFISKFVVPDVRLWWAKTFLAVCRCSRPGDPLVYNKHISDSVCFLDVLLILTFCPFYRLLFVFQVLQFFYLIGVIWIILIVFVCQHFVVAGAVADWYFKRLLDFSRLPSINCT
jgi:Plasma-membrane choline transporter